MGLIIYLRNEISLGVVGLTLTYILTLPESVIFLVQELTSLENTMIYVERTKEFMNITPESEFVKSSDKNLENWPFIPTIEFKNVQMRYRPNTPLVLKGVNFEIKAGHRVGLVGRTGSGKSSIYLCLLRLVEISSGSILIDGVNIAQIGLKKLRSSLTLVPQDPLVFSGTLQTNLDPLNLKSPAEISKALNEVGLSKYPITYELKSDGSNLSAGERQLISLGRAMLSHTKIILFDEATAGIDQAADLKIQDLICHKFNGCSILTIAHRLNTVLNSDLIIVMHDGQAKEIGSPQELLSKDSMFKNLKDRIN